LLLCRYSSALIVSTKIGDRRKTKETRKASDEEGKKNRER